MIGEQAECISIKIISIGGIVIPPILEYLPLKPETSPKRYSSDTGRCWRSYDDISIVDDELIWSESIMGEVQNFVNRVWTKRAFL